VRASMSICLSATLSVADWAHIFSIVPPVFMRASSVLHYDFGFKSNQFREIDRQTRRSLRLFRTRIARPVSAHYSLWVTYLTLNTSFWWAWMKHSVWFLLHSFFLGYFWKLRCFVFLLFSILKGDFQVPYAGIKWLNHILVSCNCVWIFKSICQTFFNLLDSWMVKRNDMQVWLRIYFLSINSSLKCRLRQSDKVQSMRTSKGTGWTKNPRGRRLKLCHRSTESQGRKILNWSLNLISFNKSLV
jgi:hypothetical protein